MMPAHSSNSTKHKRHETPSTVVPARPCACFFPSTTHPLFSWRSCNNCSPLCCTSLSPHLSPSPRSSHLGACVCSCLVASRCASSCGSLGEQLRAAWSSSRRLTSGVLKQLELDSQRLQRLNYTATTSKQQEPSCVVRLWACRHSYSSHAGAATLQGSSRHWFYVRGGAVR